MTSPVVIYCDASVARALAEPVVGWGAVIIRGDVIVEASGSFPWPLGGQTALAEIMAARHALRVAVDQKIACAGTRSISPAIATRFKFMSTPAPAARAGPTRTRRINYAGLPARRGSPS